MSKTRRSKVSPKTGVKSYSQNAFKTWVFLAKDDMFKVSNENETTETPEIVALRHPKTQQSTMFVFSPGNLKIHEIITFTPANRSWFINETVKSDGKLHLSTPVDPIFLVLPYLRKNCTNHAMLLEQAIEDESFPEMERLLKCDGLKNLHLIADKKGTEDLNAYKYNEEKALLWLKTKVERVAEVLKEKNIHVSSGAVSSTFRKSVTKLESDESDSYVKYAHGIVSEYLKDDLSQSLFKYLGIKEESVQKRKSTNSSCDQPDPKKIKNDAKKINNDSQTPVKFDMSATEDKKKTPSVSVRDKARAKAAVGSKTISSFFTKK